MSVFVRGNALKTSERDLKDLIRRVQRPEVVWRRVGSYLSMSIRRQFATEGSYHGRPWRPLKPDYLQWKIRNGYSRKTLVQTGAMKASFVSRPMSIEKYYGKYAVYGSDNELAKYHQYGTRKDGKQINPPRPMLVASKRTKAAIRGIIEDYLAGNNRPVRSYL